MPETGRRMMPRETRPSPACVAGDLVAFLVLSAFAAAIWLPAIGTPFWGDDYVYLYGARVANLAGVPWWQTFWPSVPVQFWRPLSQEAWWRVVEGAMAGDVRIAHMAALGLHLTGAAAVGLLGGTLARVCRWEQPVSVGLLSGGLYGVLAVGLLPVHWVAAVNSPVLVAFTGLAASAWLAASIRQGPLRVMLLATVPPFFALALLSKESAILTPGMLFGLSLFAGSRMRRGEWVTLAVCIVTGLVWLWLRSKVTVPPAPEYAYAFGGNLLRNAAALVAWLLNVPREALRLAATGGLRLGAAWAAAVAVPVIAAWGLALARGGLSRLSRRQWLLVLVLPVLAYAPYFPLAWNSYAYYAAIAAIVPAIALARALQGRRALLPAVLLIGASSWLAVEGTRWLDHPGLIGRARWAETTLRQLESKHPVAGSLSVHVADDQRFYAIGMYGLAWRLGVPISRIHPVGDCAQAADACLDFRADGSWVMHPAVDP
jgi:hypothetical protein